MDLLAACEDLAANVAAFDLADEDDSHVSDADRNKWEALFGFSADEAANAIRRWRADFARKSISQAAWDLVKEAKMAMGFDKESYEYSLSRPQAFRQPQSCPQTSSRETVKDDEAKYLVKLECDSSISAKSIDLTGCLPKDSKVLAGFDDADNMTRFCLLSGSQKMEFLNAVSKAYPTYEPMLSRISIASKDLSSWSSYPTLGVDVTLPQFRLDKDDLESTSPPDCVRPTQNEYPVWYFFYGTLTDANILSRAIGRTEDDAALKIDYKRARIRRGRLTTLGEKYLALVDADENSMVDGWAYQVKDQDEEDSLRVYETGKYEVVRCAIEVMEGQGRGEILKGLTFRLA